MYNIKTKRDLEAAILFLENEVKERQVQIKDHAGSLFRNFSASAILDEFSGNEALSQELKGKLLASLMGISAGFLVKRIFFRKSKKPVKKFIGNLVQYGVAYLFINPGETMKSFIAIIRDFFSQGQSQPDNDQSRSQPQG